MPTTSCSVYPRYGAGSPAMVSREIAEQVARDEKEFIKYRLMGRNGEEKQREAQRWGLRGISEVTHDKGRKGWLVFDLITGETYTRPNPEQMRKDGWVTWDELPDHYKEYFADQKPPETTRRYWFKTEFKRDREGMIDWSLKQWEPRIESVVEV